jgi:hypothetical protein
MQLSVPLVSEGPRKHRAPGAGFLEEAVPNIVGDRRNTGEAGGGGKQRIQGLALLYSVRTTQPP